MSDIEFVEEIEFERLDFDYRCPPHLRIKRYVEFICRFEKIDGMTKNALIETMTMISNRFHTVGRRNFFNFDQLTIELLKRWRKPQYCKLFKPLKTKARIVKLNKDLDTLLGVGDYEGLIYGLDDLPLMEVGIDYELDLSKDIGTAVYSDRK